MKLRSPLLLKIVATLFAALVRCWLGTIRYRTVCLDGRPHPVDPSGERFIYAFWHETLLAPLRLRVKLEMLIGQHADGEFIARVAQCCGFGVIRGSTSRGGGSALRYMMCHSDPTAHIGITPDGPRGPRRRVQIGAVAAASATQIPIVPFAIGFSRAWRARSWDRFAVPYPFTTITSVFGAPIAVPSDLTRTELEAWRQRVEQEFLAVSKMADDWAERIHRDGSQALPPVIEPTIVARAA